MLDNTLPQLEKWQLQYVQSSKMSGRLFLKLTLSCSANERTGMKLKIYLSEAWMCSEFGMLITDVERERVKHSRVNHFCVC